MMLSAGPLTASILIAIRPPTHFLRTADLELFAGLHPTEYDDIFHTVPVARVVFGEEIG